MKDCCSDSPRLLLAETCPGSTSGNKEKEAELTVGEVKLCKLRIGSGRWAPPEAPTAQRTVGSGRAGLSEAPRPRLQFWNLVGDCPAGMPKAGLLPLPPQPCSAKLFLPGRKPLVSHPLDSSLIGSGRLPIRDRSVTPGDGRGTRRGGPELKARLGSGLSCAGLPVLPGGERMPGPRTAMRLTYMSISPLQS